MVRHGSKKPTKMRSRVLSGRAKSGGSVAEGGDGCARIQGMAFYLDLPESCSIYARKKRAYDATFDL